MFWVLQPREVVVFRVRLKIPIEFILFLERDIIVFGVDLK